MMDYYGEQNNGNERSNSGSSSSRKGKKSSNSNKPKQPQRGLGVAQLEKIRLQTQLGCSSYIPSAHAPFYSNLTQEQIRMQESYPPTSSSSTTYNFHGHQSIVMRMGEVERGPIRYSDSKHSTTESWISANGMLESQQFAQPIMTRHFMNLQVEEAEKKRKKERHNSIGGGSSSQNSETSDTQELDLELKLSL